MCRVSHFWFPECSGDFPDINKFTEKLKECKFSEFKSLKLEEIQLLEDCLTNHLPRLMEELPSEKDSPETLKAKLGEATGSVVPLPTRGAKFGKADPMTAASNPFGAAEEEDEYWALEESAGRLRESFEALQPVGGFLSPQKAKQVLVKTGLQKEQLVCTPGLHFCFPTQLTFQIFSAKFGTYPISIAMDILIIMSM